MNPANPTGEPIDPALDRGGHLSELSLDRYVYDARDEAFASAVESHLETCPACRVALETLQQEDGRFDLAPPAKIIRFSDYTKNETSPAAKVVPLRKRSTLAVALPVFLAAALALVVAWPRPSSTDGHSEDTYRIKGTGFELEVQVHDGQASRLVADGDAIHPGERMGFRVRSKTAGHLIILGRDERGGLYLCYPQGDSAHSVPLAPHAEMRSLDVAMQFDDLLGEEHLTAFFCEAPLAFPTLDSGLAQPLETPPGCTRRDLTLKKVAPGSPGGWPR